MYWGDSHSARSRRRFGFWRSRSWAWNWPSTGKKTRIVLVPSVHSTEGASLTLIGPLNISFCTNSCVDSLWRIQAIKIRVKLHKVVTNTRFAGDPDSLWQWGFHFIWRQAIITTLSELNSTSCKEYQGEEKVPAYDAVLFATNDSIHHHRDPESHSQWGFPFDLMPIDQHYPVQVNSTSGG